MKIKEVARKKAAAITAALAAAAVVFGGTFAWQSIDQRAWNEADGYVNPGGRLHDDFNGENKDVYVENFTDPDDNGVPIFARIRLDEYMEIGVGAGNINDPDRNVEVIGKTDAKIDDKSTWATHIPGNVTGDAHTPIHKYWTWDMGGKTVYMPTFNKDQESLEADINGTFAGPDGIKGIDVTSGINDKYEDYKEYNLDEEKTDTAVYSAAKQQEETHRAKETLQGSVITMAEWKEKGAPKGSYWVYDTDGWAYWAEPIQPGEATGLFLNGITPSRQPDKGWYYSINVIGQFATAGDWGDKDAGTGFYADGITADGLFVLNQAAGRLPKIIHIQPKGGYKQYVKAGDTLNLEVDMDIEYPSGKPSETYVTWTAEPDTSCLNGNKFTPTDNMVEQIYKLTVTSAYDPSVTNFIEVYVYPREAVGVVNGEMDGKVYVDYGDNTFKEIKEDGSLGEFVCGGNDEIIGNADDKFNVVVIDPMDPTFGSKFIGPDVYGYYYAVGADNKLGTDDDIKVVGNPWPNNISSTLADTVTVTANNNQNELKFGKRLQIKATVTLNGNPIPDQNVTWRIEGNRDPATTIDAKGILVAGNNEPVGTVITVYAESEVQKGLEGSTGITIINLGYEDLPAMPVGTTATVTIDGIDWYVLAKDGNKALLWAKNPIGANRMFGGTTNVWKDSGIRTYLNGELLETLTLLKTKVVETEISTRTQYNASTWYTTIDKLFFLSEADLFGKHNNASVTSDQRDYTYGNSILVPDVNMRASSYISWLRSPYASNTRIATVLNNGTFNSTGGNITAGVYGVRPALWVTMP